MKQGKIGLVITVVPAGGSYVYVRVGWGILDGDDLTLKNCRVIRRFGKDQSLAGLAKNGPWKLGTDAGTKLLELAEQDNAWRPHILRDIPCDVDAWIEHCPRPIGWDEEEA